LAYGHVLGRLFEQREKALDFADGVFVGVSRAGGLVNCGVDEHGDGLRHAVENEQLVGDDEIHRRCAEFVVGRTRDDRLDVVNEFVTDETHCATSEAGQARQRDGPIFLHHALDDFETVADSGTGILPSHFKGLHHLPVLDHFDAIARLFDDGARVAAYKRVAAQVFATFHGFEQE
jgi:hypothetical protein